MNVASPSDCSKKRPVRVTALSALARGATSSRRNQKPCARLQHPVLSKYSNDHNSLLSHHLLCPLDPDQRAKISIYGLLNPDFLWVFGIGPH